MLSRNPRANSHTGFGMGIIEAVVVNYVGTGTRTTCENIKHDGNAEIVITEAQNHGKVQVGVRFPVSALEGRSRVQSPQPAL